MEEMIPEGALKRERKYIGMEDMIKFRRIKRPPRDRLQLFQPDNQLLIRLIKGCRKFNFHKSSPIGSTKY